MLPEEEVSPEQCADAAADDAGDGHSLAAAAAGLVHLAEADDTEDDRKDRRDPRAERRQPDDAEHQRGDAKAVARAGRFERRAFHREGHPAAFAVVGGDPTTRIAPRALARLR